jgi:hypothetical protein
MRHQNIYDSLCEVVRTCFSASRQIEFSPGESGINENVTTYINARIFDSQLAPYDQKELLRLTEGIIEANDEEAKITGNFQGQKYEIRLIARENPAKGS